MCWRCVLVLWAVFGCRIRMVCVCFCLNICGVPAAIAAGNIIFSMYVRLGHTYYLCMPASRYLGIFLRVWLLVNHIHNSVVCIYVYSCGLRPTTGANHAILSAIQFFFFLLFLLLQRAPHRGYMWSERWSLWSTLRKSKVLRVWCKFFLLCLLLLCSSLSRIALSFCFVLFVLFVHFRETFY